MKRFTKKSHFDFFVLFIGFLLLIGLTGCKKRSEPPTSKFTRQFHISEGKRLFLHYCSPCHGENADGSGRYFPSYIRPQPPDMIKSTYLLETDDAVIFKAIKFGSQSLGKSSYSPPYGRDLRDEEIESIISFLHSLINH
jgi:mono/diheme cytochrome c family protein